MKQKRKDLLDAGVERPEGTTWDTLLALLKYVLSFFLVALFQMVSQLNRVYCPPISHKGSQGDTGCLHFVSLIHSTNIPLTFLHQ